MLGPRKVLASSLFTSFVIAACGGSAEPPKEPSAAPAVSSPAPHAAAGEGASLTAEACEASGGVVVGDIGDGAIHRPGYKCASGAKPSGSIRAAEGGPVAVEGSVCCPR